jgi:hypothetical protein
MSTKERVETLRKMKPNTWIALASDESRVVGRGKTYLEAVEAAKAKGEGDPVLIKAPHEWVPMVL